jgi:hypothetical protein
MCNLPTQIVDTMGVAIINVCIGACKSVTDQLCAGGIAPL